MKSVWSALCLLLLVALAGPAGGCASNRVDWTTRVGSYTYDDAIRELGPPDKSAKLTDGATVADWMTSRGMRTATTFGTYHSPRYGYGYGWGGPGYTIVDPPSPDRFLRLTFDPQGVLASWERVYR